MGKSMNGPDMVDITAYLVAIDNMNKCSTSLLLLVGGTVLAPSLSVTVCSVSNECGVEGPKWTLGTSYQWPNRESKTFAGSVYRALVEQDKQISSRSMQEELGLT